MAFKILTGKGVENTNIDAARQQFFIAGMRDGIFKGALNELEFSSLTSSGISLDTGVLSIGGHIVINDEIWPQTFTTSLAEDTRYSLIAQLVVDGNSNTSFSLIVQDVSIPLVKNNMFRTEIGAGTYQVEIGRFTVTTLGTVTDIKRTLDVITGGSGGAGEHFVLGTITTITLDVGMEANLTGEDIYDANGNYIQTNFVLEIPATAGTVVKVNDVEQASLNFIGDPQTQLNNKVEKETGKGLSTEDYTTEEKTKLGGIEAEANKTIVDSALSSSSENPLQNKVVKNALDTKADANNVYTKTETDNLLMHEKIYQTTTNATGTYNLSSGKKFSDWKWFVFVFYNESNEYYETTIPVEVFNFSTSRKFNTIGGGGTGSSNRYIIYQYLNDTQFSVTDLMNMKLVEIWGYK